MAKIVDSSLKRLNIVLADSDHVNTVAKQLVLDAYYQNTAPAFLHYYTLNTHCSLNIHTCAAATNSSTATGSYSYYWMHYYCGCHCCSYHADSSTATGSYSCYWKLQLLEALLLSSLLLQLPLLQLPLLQLLLSYCFE
jgi:hypothetical protein